MEIRRQTGTVKYKNICTLVFFAECLSNYRLISIKELQHQAEPGPSIFTSNELLPEHQILPQLAKSHLIHLNQTIKPLRGGGLHRP